MEHKVSIYGTLEQDILQLNKDKIYCSREYCREQLIKFSSLYKKDDYSKVGSSFGNSITSFVGRAINYIPDKNRFCDEIDIEKLFEEYLRYKELNLYQLSDEQQIFLPAYMAKIYKKYVNDFYRNMRNEVVVMPYSVSKAKKSLDLYYKRWLDFKKEYPTIIRAKY